MKSYRYIFLLPLAVMALTSCNDDETYADWQPGETDTNPGVYFTADNVKLTSITSGGNTTATLKMGRTNRNGELIVPLETVNTDSRIIIPSSVTFADGNEYAEIDVDCSGLPQKEVFDIEIKIDDKFVNTYSKGYPSYVGQVIISDWDKVNNGEEVTFKIFDSSYELTEWATWTSEMYNLGGTQQYRINNFMNSGVDFKFEIQASTYPGYEGYGRIVPMGNQTFYEEIGWSSYGEHEWFFTDDNGDFPEFGLYSSYDNSYYPMWGVNFRWYDDDYQSEYCYARIMDWNDASGQKDTRNYAYMNFYGYYDADYANYTNYLYLYFSWK